VVRLARVTADAFGAAPEPAVDHAVHDEIGAEGRESSRPRQIIREVAWPMRYRSIFTESSPEERRHNFDDYLAYTRRHGGELIEPDKDLSAKRARLQYFREHPVRARRPLEDPAAFYQNHVVFRDDPRAIDRRVLLWTCVYKFARHEWVGISAAWDASPRLADARTVVARISRYHLAEEFCHVRFFEEMFRTFGLDRVVWRPLGPFKQRVYRLFPNLPGLLMDPIAFVTELLGVTFYRHVDALLDPLFDDEPEARRRVRELLYEIMADEIAHVGQRRNFLGNGQIQFARRIIPAFFRLFLRDLPESARLFDVGRMARDGLAFDYSGLPDGLVARSWVPSYCRTPRERLEPKSALS
jgi:hypothetical protein